jgi:uncharacterized protein
LISAAIKDRIPEKVILWIVENPSVFWSISDEILSEYVGVISRPKFKLSTADIYKWTELILESTIIENPVKKIDYPQDVLDAKFIECAIHSNLDYIITGDRHFKDVEILFNIKIISANRFYDEFVNN